MSKKPIIRWHNWCKDAKSEGSRTRSKELALNSMQDGIGILLFLQGNLRKMPETRLKSGELLLH